LEELRDNHDLVCAHVRQHEALNYRLEVVFGNFEDFVLFVFLDIEVLTDVSPDFVALAWVHETQTDIFLNVFLFP
jgi:hypothetical protein